MRSYIKPMGKSTGNLYYKAPDGIQHTRHSVQLSTQNDRNQFVSEGLR
jgi:hypothetical protein